MATTLMGAEQESLLIYSHSYETALGTVVGNDAHIDTTVLGKQPDGSCLVHANVIGRHLGPPPENVKDDYRWLNVYVLFANAMNITGKKYCMVLGNVIPFYYQNVMNDSGYNPFLQVNNNPEFLSIGRVYSSSGDLGLWPMSELHEGSYAFGVYGKVW